jgi:hypothetical protein
MEDGIVEYLRKRTTQVPQKRAQLWHLDYCSVEAYEKSVAQHRDNLRKIAGAVDPRVSSVAAVAESVPGVVRGAAV